MKGDKNMTESEKRRTGYLNATDELRKLIIENPDLPMLVLAGADSNIGDWSWMTCSSVHCTIGEFLDCDQTVNDERVYTDRDDFEEDLEDHLYDPELHDGLTDEMWDHLVKDEVAEYDPFWKKCIIVYVDN